MRIETLEQRRLLAAQISEFQPNPIGSDPAKQTFELSGTPGDSFSGVIVSIESDPGGANPGDINNVEAVSGTFDSNGLLTVAVDDLENPSFTIALLDSFSGSTSTDIDSDNNGIVDDISSFGTVWDAIGIPDTVGDQTFLYGAELGGTDFNFTGDEPRLVFRDASVGDLYAVNDPDEGVVVDVTGTSISPAIFDTDPTAGTDTFGTVNPSVTGGGSFADKLIHEIQGETNLADGTIVGTPGSADESPELGNGVRVQGVVTSVLPGLNGFYVQEEDSEADGNDFTSEGIFVLSSATVSVGNIVTVEGNVAEVEGETRINAADVVVDSPVDNSGLVTATPISFPTATVLQDADGDFVANLEAYEGMLVSVAEAMSVTELFQLDRFGTIRISSEGRLEQYTQNNTPDAVGFAQHLKDIAARSLIIDDGLDIQNPSPIAVPGLGVDSVLDAGDIFRMGDQYTGLVGVLSYSEDNQTSSEEPEYRLHSPTGILTNVNARTSQPDDVGSDFKVASFNVLNFFTTLDTFPNNEQVGPNGDSPRGADTNPQNALSGTGATDEFDRQLEKLVQALVDIDADVVGLIEIENDFLDPGISPIPQSAQDPREIPIQELVNSLNAQSTTTYDWVRPGEGQEFAGDDVIAVGFIYDTATVNLSGAAAILESFGGESFLDPNNTGESRNRAALAQTFQEVSSGETFTAVVNHFKSKGSSGLFGGPLSNPDVDQLDGQGFWNDTRTDAARILADWLATDPTGSGDDDVLILGDLNAYANEDPITMLEGAGYANLAGSSGYSFVFDGQRGTLDYALVNSSLNGQVTGVTEWHSNADEADAFDYNLEFGRDPALFTAGPFRASDHDPVIIGLDLGPQTFQLQLLHASDLEGGVDAISNAPNFAAVVEGLEIDAAAEGIASILLSAGDNYIPGPFFSAGGDSSLRETLSEIYLELFGQDPSVNPDVTGAFEWDIREGSGRVDITIMNVLGFDASAIGNHEFDQGSDAFESIIEEDVRDDFNDDGLSDEIRWLGAQFPYLSANLDFSADGDLSNLVTLPGQPNTDFGISQGQFDSILTAANSGDPVALDAALQALNTPKIAPSTVIQRSGELIGVVGATTQLIDTITSPSGTVDSTGGAVDMDALAAALQPVINDLTNTGINKVILVSHLQQIELEESLATKLSGVDVIIAGGSDTILANEDDTLRSDDTAEREYPIVTSGLNPLEPTVIVSTAGEYSYVGQLTIEFDASGVLVDSQGNPIDDFTDFDLTRNGPVATTDASVAEIWGTLNDPFLPGTKGEKVQRLVDTVTTVVNTTDGNVFGLADVFIEGRREFVRTEETTVGNLTADANLFAAKQFDPSVQVSLKNGGGIRAAIGEIDGFTGELLPPQANPDAGKAEGEISQLDIENTLRFNNGLTLLTVAAEELKQLLEHGVAATATGATPGQFPQVSGMTFSFDESQQAIQFDSQANVVTPGERIRSLALVDLAGEVVDIIVKDGVLVGDPMRPIRMVTLDFLFGIFSSSDFIGGDGYPLPAFAADVVQLKDQTLDAGSATFTDPGTEQDAFAEYLVANFPADRFDAGDETPAFTTEETAPHLDTRIQNLAARSDGILDGLIIGTEGNDVLVGTFGQDRIFGLGGNDLIIALSGDDFVSGGSGNDKIFGGFGDDLLFGDDGNDKLYGGFGDDVAIGGDGRDKLFGSFGRDVLIGGDGTDTLRGGFGSDLLVTGLTVFDKDTDALQAIGQAWSSNIGYVQRVNALRTGLGGLPRLDASTVSQDQDKDDARGRSSLDWFFAGVGDSLDRSSSEFLN